MEMRDPRMHRCVAWTIAMVILDFMKLDVSGQDLRVLTSLVRRLHVHIFTLLGKKLLTRRNVGWPLST